MGFDGDKVAYEHIYWDQASLLVQVGVLDPGDLPIVGADQGRAMVDSSVPIESPHRRRAVGRARAISVDHLTGCRRGRGTVRRLFMDALGHIYNDGVGYNGRCKDEVFTSEGLGGNAITAMRDGVFTRGAAHRPPSPPTFS
jgi:hypothetical protein